MNPFKFGTIVQDEYFTDCVAELESVKQMLDSENHLVLISPRRFGKSSLVAKALVQLKRPAISIDMMKVLSVEDLALQLLKGVFKIHRLEKVKHLMSHFRIAPTVSYNPMNDAWDVTFTPSVAKPSVALEDALELLAKVSSPEQRLIVVFDEFQEVNEIDGSLAKQLRAIMQRQQGLNYVFMGSQESMMEEIFEQKKSPFYHFGQRMTLKKIPYDDFFAYIVERLPEGCDREDIAGRILLFTHAHPYYSQQLASAVYNLLVSGETAGDIVQTAIDQQVQEHDLDYERLWQSLKRTDRKVLLSLAKGINPMTDRSTPPSTVFSSLKRLTKQGYVIRTNTYELEDPFWGEWMVGA